MHTEHRGHQAQRLLSLGQVYRFIHSHLFPPRWKLLLNRTTKKAREGISTFSFEAEATLKSSFNHSAYSPDMSTCILQLMVYSLNTKTQDSLICFLQHFPLSPCCSTFTEPGLVCQVRSLKGMFPVSCAASTYLSIRTLSPGPGSPLDILPDSCQAGLVRTEQGTPCLCSVIALVGFRHPLPPHHAQRGAAAAPGQGQNWPPCVASVLFHLHADSPFSDKLAGVATKPGTGKELELNTAPSEATRTPTEKQTGI